MLRELLDLVRAKSPLSEMLSEFTQMIEIVEWMFDTSIQVLMSDKPAQEVNDEIYAKDREVNEHQRSIRRKIIRHLTIKPGGDVPACLVMMSVVKDAERMGDFCKNIFELGAMINVPFDSGRYKTPFIELSEQVENLFGKTRQCDMLLKQLVVDNISTDKAVAYTLLARYFKRISSHLVNIATSVVTSVDNLDYLDES
jgi:phosphate uptake regulator